MDVTIVLNYSKFTKLHLWQRNGTTQHLAYYIKAQLRFFKHLNRTQRNLTGRKISMSSTKCIFRTDRKTKMVTLASDWLTFFSLQLWNGIQRNFIGSNYWTSSTKFVFKNLGRSVNQDGRPGLRLAEIFLYARLQTGRIMVWWCPSVRVSVRPSDSPSGSLSASFPHFSLTIFYILSWNFEYDLVLMYSRSSLSVIILRQLTSFWT